MNRTEALEILKKQDSPSAPSPWFMQNFISKYINNKIETAQSEDLSNLSSDTLAKLEKSDPISQEINRKLVKPLQVAGIAANDIRQVGGIALTGQFSFLDREKFHKDNKTYKDFPPLPESWKTEHNSPKPNTQETQTNHDPANNTHDGPYRDWETGGSGVVKSNI